MWFLLSGIRKAIKHTRTKTLTAILSHPLFIKYRLKSKIRARTTMKLNQAKHIWRQMRIRFTSLAVVFKPYNDAIPTSAPMQKKIVMAMQLILIALRMKDGSWNLEICSWEWRHKERFMFFSNWLSFEFMIHLSFRWAISKKKPSEQNFPQIPAPNS